MYLIPAKLILLCFSKILWVKTDSQGRILQSGPSKLILVVPTLLKNKGKISCAKTKNFWI